MTIEGRSDAKLGGRIRLGMVGGGEGAFIGAVHRIAARIDDQYELVAGAPHPTMAARMPRMQIADAIRTPDFIVLSSSGKIANLSLSYIETVEICRKW